MTRGHPFGWVFLALCVLGVTFLRVQLLYAGPDLDTDSYGHAVIGRTLLLAPWDLRQHWVWLPLWQYLFAALAKGGFGIEDVRLFNIFVGALPPVLITALLIRGTRPERLLPSVAEAFPFVAGALTCFWPLFVTHGQSAEPETVFTTLALAALLASEDERPLLCGLFLAVACLLRYEAWVLVPVIALACAARGMKTRRFLRDLAGLVLPAITVAAWIVLHHNATGEWLQFLRYNREFVAQARVRPPDLGGGVAHYALRIPTEQVGRSLAWLIPGTLWLLTRGPWTVRVAGPTLFAFIAWGFVRGEHLGLARHLFVLVPFFSAAIAAGPLAFASLIAGRFPRISAPGLAFVCAVVWAVTLGNQFFRRTLPDFTRIREFQAGAFQKEREAARLVREEARGLIFCNLPRVEIFSELPPERFARTPWPEIDPAALTPSGGEGGTAVGPWVVAHPDHLARFAGWGRVRFDSPEVRVIAAGP